ncbi:MAG: S1C family serine protease [Rhodospirillaceae bacterium]
MKRVSLYSSSRRSTKGRGIPLAPQTPESETENPAAAPAPAPKPPGRVRRFFTRYERPVLVAISALISVGAIFVYAQMQEPPRVLTQKDIDNAVMHTFENKMLPSRTAKAAAIIRPSVVRVTRKGKNEDDPDVGVGTGVIIQEDGTILTNLHVVAGADRVEVEFFDGSTSEADVTGVQPEHDLAIIQAKTLPDDMKPATMRSTAGLLPGDEVVAVGHPFGIGPSTSAGVVSGLRRDYVNPKGKRVLTNLIQFDAAANPGNSGGPLITLDGEVVGIVTAILNPTEQRVFIGIGFAVPIENAAAGAGMSPF